MDQQQSGAPNGERSGDGGARTFGQRVDRVSDTAQQAWTRTRDAFDDIKGTLDVDGRVDRHPYGTLAAALGVGYVLGGGLFSPLTARILGLGLRIGIRLAALPVLKDELFGFAERMGEGESGEEGSGGKSRRTKHAITNKGRTP